MTEIDLPEHVRENRRYWDSMAGDWIASGERGWRDNDPLWGCWQIPEAQLGLLPKDMTGMMSIELGCGTAYISSWLRLFRDTGFEVLDYHELQAPEGSEDRHGVAGKWAQNWPAEQVWRLRRC